MRKGTSCLAPIALFAVVVAGCSSGMSSPQVPSGTNMAQGSLTIHDSPPMGVTVLSFGIEVTGAALQPSDSSLQPVSMISEPDDIELEHLQACRIRWFAKVGILSPHGILRHRNSNGRAEERKFNP